MTKFSNNTAEDNIINIIYDTLYKRLDEIGIPKDCSTRGMSWDEAASECWDLAGDEKTDIEIAYRTALQLYRDASRLWESIEDTVEIFKH